MKGSGMPWADLPPGAFGIAATASGADANLVWADASGFRDFMRSGDTPPIGIPVLVEVKEGKSVGDLSDELKVGERGRVAPIYLNQSPGTRYCVAEFSQAYCLALRDDPLLGAMIRRFELQMPVIPQRARPERPSSATAPPEARVRAGKYLLGVIDSGCPFAHANLRGPLGTRVINLWDQDRNPAFTQQPANGACPEEFGYGCEVNRGQLNRVIADAAAGGVVDEDACYERAGYTELRHRLSHAAAVLDLLAGPRHLGWRLTSDPDSPPRWTRADDRASAADIVFVQLPQDLVQDSSSAALPRSLLDGLRYILSCADPAVTERIVVNISNGTSRGSHDGESIIECAMRELVANWRLAHPHCELHIVLPAGNSFDEERHAQLDHVAPGQPESVFLQLPPGTEVPSYVLIGLPRGDVGSVSIRVVPPGADSVASQPIGAGASRAWPNAAKAECAVVFPAADDAGTSAPLIAFAPTAAQDPAVVLAPTGQWTIIAEATRPLAGPVHLYIARNQVNPGALPRAKQARFVDIDGQYDPCRWRRSAECDPVPPLSPIRRSGTLSGLATIPTGCGVLVAGSRFRREGTPSLYSSTGPANGGAAPRQGPDCFAFTDESRALPGIRVGGYRSGDIVAVKGTSFAAPQVARAILDA